MFSRNKVLYGFENVDNDFSKSLTVWTITFVELFDIFQLLVCIPGKEPADCKLAL